jgi:lycopene cyclase domain-containing protein
MKYTYLLVNFFTIIIPFIFSFHPKLKFYKTWRAFFPAVLLTAVFFLLWDNYFTGLGVWGFNREYIIGIFLGHLPVEEVLFFFCIPYACIYTYHCINLLLDKTPAQKSGNTLTMVFMVSFLALAMINYRQTYTLFAFLCPAILLILAKFAFKVSWLNRFYLIYAILLLPFLVVNGVLTGTGLEKPVVWYNDNEIIGYRIHTIPVEDVFYGMAMILMNLMIYKALLSKAKPKA